MTLLNSLTNTAAIGATLLVTSATISAADFSALPAGTYELDSEHAYVNFQYNHLGLSNPTLSFDDFTVSVDLDNANPSNSSISVTIDPNSIEAGSDIWKEHLVGEKWFDTANNPDITFQSTSIESTGEGTYQVMGNVTIKGETRPMTLDTTINAAMMHPMSGKPVFGLDATGNLLRSDFGMGASVPFVSDEIAINLTVEMVAAE